MGLESRMVCWLVEMFEMFVCLLVLVLGLCRRSYYSIKVASDLELDVDGFWFCIHG